MGRRECTIGTGDFEAPELFDYNLYIDQLLAPGGEFDPHDGDNVAAAIGALAEGQFQHAGCLLFMGHEHEFCARVRAETEAYCRRMAYAAAAREAAK
jgi:hypothetical protein